MFSQNVAKLLSALALCLNDLKVIITGYNKKILYVNGISPHIALNQFNIVLSI